MDDKRILKGGNINENNNPKKPFIDTFREQKKELEEDASESDKREMAHPAFTVIESVDDLVQGDLEPPLTTVETAVKTMDEYSQALNNFLED